ncbi:MAG: hypothetical protein D3916_10625, partial [Candidatus Electrothrix sp. MAN1_4]|nr:hypothetical protein [Candidatus Electrothrix sp. MAN1_4]
MGGGWDELVHDRFVEPILQTNRKWLEQQGPLLRDALAWKESNKTDQSLLCTGEKLIKTLAERAERTVLEPVITEFLEASKTEQERIEEQEKTKKLFLKYYRISLAGAFILVLAGLWGTWGNYKARKALVQLQQAEKLQTGMALNAKAALAENEGSRLYAHLYSLHALDKLGKNNKGSDTYMEAVIRAQANPVPVPAFVGHHAERVRSVAFSPDGRTVASASDDKTIGIWEVQTGNRLKTFKEEDNVRSVAFSEDGRLIASAYGEKDIGIWNVQTGQRLRTIEGHTDWVWGVAFSPDGHLLASNSKDKTIGIWDISTGNRLQTIKAYQTGGDHSISFSLNGQTLAGSCYDGTIGIWDVQTGNRQHILDGYGNVGLSVAFSPDGHRLAAGSFGTFDLWDMETDQRLRTIKDDDYSMFLGLSFSPDGRTLAAGSFRNIISIWEVQTGQRLRFLQGTATGRSVAFSPDGQTIVSSGSWNKTVGLWEAATGRIRELKGHAGPVTNIWFSPDGHNIVSVSKDKTIGIWDAITGRYLQKIPLQGMTGMDYVIFSPDGHMFAVGSWGSNSIRLGEVSTGRLLKILEGHTDQVDNFSFSPDSRIITSASSDKTVKVWDVQTGKCQRTLSVEDEVETSISFSPDGRLFAVGLKNKTINIWDIPTGKRLQTFKGISGVSIFSSDSRLLAVSDSDTHTITILDTSTDQPLQTLKGHMAFWISDSTFSPDSSLFVSKFMDKTIAVWDIKTGKRIRTLKNTNINIGSESTIAFSPDGKTLAYTTDDNAIALWDFEPTVNEFSGISLDENGEYKIDLDTLPYKLEGLDLVSVEQQQTGPDKPARWSRYHPFHWLPAAEKGDSNAMLQIGIIYDRNNDITRALRWYGKAIMTGNEQDRKQQ